MMEERNHETTGQAMGASEPDTVYDAVVPGDPSRVSPTGTAPRHGTQRSSRPRLRRPAPPEASFRRVPSLWLDRVGVEGRA